MSVCYHKQMPFGTGGNTDAILQINLRIVDISYYIKKHINVIQKNTTLIIN